MTCLEKNKLCVSLEIAQLAFQQCFGNGEMQNTQFLAQGSCFCQSWNILTELVCMFLLIEWCKNFEYVFREWFLPEKGFYESIGCVANVFYALRKWKKCAVLIDVEVLGIMWWWFLITSVSGTTICWNTRRLLLFVGWYIWDKVL